MNKFILCFFITFLTSLSCFAYTEDPILQKCMKDGNYTTAAMIQCTYDRGYYIKELSQKQIKNLKNKLSQNDYNKLVENQILFKQYAESLDKGAIKILYSTMGSIYPTIASILYYEVYRQNTLILDMVNTNKICSEKLQNELSITEIDKEIHKKLNELKTNLNPTKANLAKNKSAYIYEKDYNQYSDIEKSQRIWEKYLADTKKNILPLFKTQPEIQNYILRLIYEDRLAVLSTVNTPFKL